MVNQALKGWPFFGANESDSNHFMRQSGGLSLVSGWTETTLQCFESRHVRRNPDYTGHYLADSDRFRKAYVVP